MSEAFPERYDLDAMLEEIAADEKVDREARRILSQEDIRRLVDETRRRRESASSPSSQ